MFWAERFGYVRLMCGRVAVIVMPMAGGARGWVESIIQRARAESATVSGAADHFAGILDLLGGVFAQVRAACAGGKLDGHEDGRVNRGGAWLEFG